MIPALFGIAKLFAPVVLPKVVEAITDKNPTAGAVADAVVKVASQVTGIPIATEADAHQALAMIQADPALQLQMIRQTDEATHALLKLDNEDRADARAMQRAAMESEDPFVRRFTYYFIIVWSAFCFMYLPAITFIEFPPASQRIVDTILGFLLGTGIASMFAFLLGSSAGSKAKTEQMAAALRR